MQKYKWTELMVQGFDIYDLITLVEEIKVKLFDSKTRMNRLKNSQFVKVLL